MGSRFHENFIRRDGHRSLESLALRQRTTEFPSEEHSRFVHWSLRESNGRHVVLMMTTSITIASVSLSLFVDGAGADP